jgi:hypothetical protein
VLWLAASSSSVAPLFGGGEVAGRWRSGRRWCAPWAPASTSRPTSGCGSPRRRRGGWLTSTRTPAGTCRSPSAAGPRCAGCRATSSSTRATASASAPTCSSSTRYHPSTPASTPRDLRRDRASPLLLLVVASRAVAREFSGSDRTGLGLVAAVVVGV